LSVDQLWCWQRGDNGASKDLQWKPAGHGASLGSRSQFTTSGSYGKRVLEKLSQREGNIVKYLNIIKGIYDKPTASIILNAVDLIIQHSL
jgi:hypothetical protein